MATVNLFGALALDTTLQTVRDHIASLIGRRGTTAAADQTGIPALAMRGDADTITTSDGDLSLLRLDEVGRLKVATQPGSFPSVVGTIPAKPCRIGSIPYDRMRARIFFARAGS